MLDYIQDDIRKAIIKNGKAMAGCNEWVIYKSPHTIIVRLSGNPHRPIDKATVDSWMMNGYDHAQVVKECHKQDYYPVYVNMLHAILCV
ncbi:hypothetical protein ZPAH1_orf00057 [Aeromonas phage ZPAH1]|nr:hypothetical protein ZPAH1_orf00057 [Aeromonas phage ZPAH1]